LVRKSVLCEPCEKYILPEALSKETQEYFDVEYLFKWHPLEAGPVPAIVFYLKGDQKANNWFYYARTFMALRGTQACIPSKNLKKVFFHAPGQRKQRDHAYYWAYFLSLLYGAPLEKNFFTRKQTNTAQKELNRQERKKIELIPNELEQLGLKYPTAQYEYIFCDDVLTTGATSIAAFVALGKPKNFSVWILARRMENRNGRGGSI
jgi:hypothetical protein